MGVTYKLTDDIVQYIIEQKKQVPDLSLRELVELVSAHFQVPVSKSSIHDVLKEAQISSPRGRKVKNKFEIPAEKKAQLLANLPAIVPPKPKTQVPSVAAEVKPQIQYRHFIKQPDFLKPLEPDGLEALSEFLLKAAFYDLFPQSTPGLSYQDFKTLPPNALGKELLYRVTPIAGFKLTLEDGAVLYIDARFKTLSWDLAPDVIPAPIERALTDMAARLLGEVQPIILQILTENKPLELLGHFLGFLEGKKNKGLSELALVSPQGSNVVGFSAMPAKRNRFILGMESKLIDYKRVMNGEHQPSTDTRSHCFSSPVTFTPVDYPWDQGKFRTILLQDIENKEDMLLVSNMGDAVSDGAIARQYAERAQRAGMARREKTLDAQTSQENPLQSHLVDNILGKRFPIEQWSSLAALAGERRSNDQYYILDVPVDPLYSFRDALTQAIEAFNALSLQDSRGRLIHVILSDKKSI